MKEETKAAIQEMFSPVFGVKPEDIEVKDGQATVRMDKVPDGPIHEWETYAKPDWSSLMTDLYRSLTRAEDQLRLIHMNPDHKHSAKGHLIVSRAILKQLEDWCGNESL